MKIQGFPNVSQTQTGDLKHTVAENLLCRQSQRNPQYHNMMLSDGDGPYSPSEAFSECEEESTAQLIARQSVTTVPVSAHSQMRHLPVISPSFLLAPLAAIVVLLDTGNSFSPKETLVLTRKSSDARLKHRGLLLFSTVESPSEKNADAVFLMLEELRSAEPYNATLLSGCIEKLEATVGPDKHKLKEEDDQDSNRFDPLLGLYDVSFVQTTKEGDNPVGGKWTRKNGLAQKILSTRRSFQHILRVNETGCGATQVRTATGYTKVVGEAINVISLDALWGLIRTTIILRGDAIALNATERVTDTCQPLSSRAVRALFDAPRIVVGRAGRWLNINVGPKTSVVLDTTYVDDKVRIGLGGRSGTRFIFRRCNDGGGDDVEANEFRALLSRKPWSRRKTLTALLGVAAASIYGSVMVRGISRVVGGIASIVTLMAATLIAFSGGGIEADDRSVAEAKKILP